MSSVRLGSYDPSGGDPLDPDAREGQTVLPPMAIQGEPLDTGKGAPAPAGPTVDENGKWDIGYTMPIPKPGRGPVPTYEEDRDYDGLPANSQRASIAQNDTEKKAHFDALRELFGLAPDPKAQPQAQPVHPDAQAHPDSPEFKAWLRSAPPEEFEKWMMSAGQSPTAAPPPTEAAIARARAALAAPMSSGELSQQMAAMPQPSRPPTPPVQTPYEQALQIRSLSKKSDEARYQDEFEQQVAHAQQRAAEGGTNGAMTPLEQAQAIARLAAQKKPLAERAYDALPGPSMAQGRAAIAGKAPVAQKGVAAAAQPTMMNDFAGRGWQIDPRTGQFDPGSPIVSPEEQARQIGELVRAQTPEQAKAARDKAFMDALNGVR